MLNSFDVSLLGKALLAAAVGFVIGWEREDSGAPAGDRTFALVCLGAAVLSAFAQEAYPANGDRIIAGVVSGIAFLGTGIILHRSTGEVRGLTTAAGFWVTTSLGVLIGTGHAVVAVLLTGMVLVILMWENIPFVARLHLANTRSNVTDERTRAMDRAVIDTANLDESRGSPLLNRFRHPLPRPIATAAAHTRAATSEPQHGDSPPEV